MATDYKEILGELLGKAKDFTENTGVKEIYEKGAQRAKSFGNAAKLTLDLNSDHKELDRIYAEIGRLYVSQLESSGSSPEGFFAPLVEQLGVLRQSIEAKQAEIEAYRSSFGSEQNTVPTPHDEIADFEAIVNQTEDEGKA